MGIDLQPYFVYKFIYRLEFADRLVEHEYDHVFTGTFDGQPVINTREVEAWKFVDMEELSRDVIANPTLYTYWLRLILSHHRLPQ